MFYENHNKEIITSRSHRKYALKKHICCCKKQLIWKYRPSNAIPYCKYAASVKGTLKNTILFKDVHSFFNFAAEWRCPYAPNISFYNGFVTFWRKGNPLINVTKMPTHVFFLSGACFQNRGGRPRDKFQAGHGFDGYLPGGRASHSQPQITGSLQVATNGWSGWPCCEQDKRHSPK